MSQLITVSKCRILLCLINNKNVLKKQLNNENKCLVLQYKNAFMI